MMVQSRKTGVALLAGLAMTAAASAQDLDVGSDPARIVESRRSLMQAMDNNLIALERAGESPEYLTGLVTGQDLSAMLLTSTLLFPRETNPAENPDIETTANELVWSENATFQTMMLDARAIAEEMAAATSSDSVVELAGEIRTMCTACHERYVDYE